MKKNFDKLLDMFNLGERASSIVYTSIGTFAILLFFGGLLGVWGLDDAQDSPELIKTLKVLLVHKKDASAAWIHSFAGGFLVIVILLIATAYLRFSSRVGPKERITPLVMGLEEAPKSDSPGSENHRVQLWSLFLYVGFPFIANIFYLIVFFKEHIVGKGTASKYGRWNLPKDSQERYSLGEGGIDYVPFITDIALIFTWILVILLFIVWRRLYKKRAS